MKRRPIFWGIILLIIGIIGWFISVILAVVTLGHFRQSANFFGALAYIGFPASLVFEFVKWIKKRKNAVVIEKKDK